MESSQTQQSPIRSGSRPELNIFSSLNRDRILAIWRSSRTGLLLGIAFVLFMALVQFSTVDMPDNDGFYHIKLAYLMRTESLKPDFPWLPLSILNPREFYDHHFLFHVALIPFTFGDLRIGAKLAAVVFSSLAFLSAWNLLKNQRIPLAALWALGLIAVSEAFIYRMSITRAQSLSLAVLMLGLDWLLRKKFNRLAFLAFLYVWLYNAFPLLMIVAGLYVLAAWLIERRLDVRPIVSVAVGTILGLVINPYFPHNIIFAAMHIMPKLVGATEISVGNEWYPYNTTQILENSPLALVAFVSGALAMGLNPKRLDLRTAMSFLLACLFGLMLFQSRRFVEYFPAFSLIFAAFAWAPLIEGYLNLHADTNTANRKLPLWKQPCFQRAIPAIILFLALIPCIWGTLNQAQDSIQQSKSYTTYAGSSAWLEDNSPAGSRVFQTDWDDFPRLFYYNDHNTYLIGLDPTYMQLYDSELYSLWVKITRGEVELPSSYIVRDFGARYVLTDLRHKDFLQQAADDPGLTEVYRDHDSVVFQVAGFK